MTEQDDYPGRSGYQTLEKAERYAGRSSSRNRAEARMLQNLVGEILSEGSGQQLRALDIPAGEGRAARLLRDLGFETVEADISESMLIIGRRKGRDKGSPVVADLEGCLPFADATFDLVLCWRLLHHLPTPKRISGVLLELSRVSRKWIVISFFHPVSLHHLQRKLSGLFTGRKDSRYAFTLRQIEEAGHASGLRLWNKTAQLPYLRDLWAAAFVKDPAAFEKGR